LLAGDWRVTGGVLNITAAAWTADFHWWRSGNITRTQNVSEYMLVLALCHSCIHSAHGPRDQTPDVLAYDSPSQSVTEHRQTGLCVSQPLHASHVQIGLFKFNNAKCVTQNSLPLGQGRSIGAKISGGKGSSLGNIFWFLQN